MKILLGHNYYRSSAPSGEDVVFRNERMLLEKKGVEIIAFERFNDDIDDATLFKRIRLALRGAWSRQTYNDVSHIIRKTRPDVAHFHNTFPLITASAYAACQDYQVPVVQTLHNFRFICPNALLIRDGKPCEDCVGTNLVPALKYRCYRGSIAASGAQVWAISRNRWCGTYKTLVNRYIALTHFAASKLVAGGLPKDRMSVKSNFLPVVPEANNKVENYAVYVGRLTEEKGVRTLLEAWKKIRELPLKIVGDGALRSELEDLVKQHSLTVEFLGYRSNEEAINIVSKAKCQIIPSECYEGFPMVVLEAYACGTPVIASRIGSLDEIVIENKVGVKFEPGNASDLAEKVNYLKSDEVKLTNYMHNARKILEENYTAENNYLELMGIYEEAIKDLSLATRRLGR